MKRASEALRIATEHANEHEKIYDELAREDLSSWPADFRAAYEDFRRSMRAYLDARASGRESAAREAQESLSAAGPTSTRRS